MKHFYQTAWIKARILAGGTVDFSDRIPSEIRGRIDSENHHHDQWLFIRINERSRARLVASNDPAFLIDYDNHNQLILTDKVTEEVLIKGLEIEEAVIHAPKQLFLGLYEYCRIGCRFCPLSKMHTDLIHYSLDSIYKDISLSKDKDYTSVGITTAIPYFLQSDDVADEMIFLVKKIRERIGPDIPIGISTKIPSEEKLRLLKEAGACEARLNIETTTQFLADKLMPNKPLNDIYESIKTACKIFGRGKVSSNIVLGLGENDADVLECVERLAEIGSIATLYPYDPFDGGSTASSFQRPDAERLYGLAVKHKEILQKYSLDTSGLLTMCPDCSASHIFPGKDL